VVSLGSSPKLRRAGSGRSQYAVIRQLQENSHWTELQLKSVTARALDIIDLDKRRQFRGYTVSRCGYGMGTVRETVGRQYKRTGVGQHTKRLQYVCTEL
jgi:hypothetical protein